MIDYYYLEVDIDSILPGDECYDLTMSKWRPVNPQTYGMKYNKNWYKCRRVNSYYEMNKDYIFNLVQG